MRRLLFGSASLLFLLIYPLLAAGQRPVPRITQPVSNRRRVALHGSISPLARPQDDQGAVSPSMRLQNMALVFRPSAAQQAALDQLLAQQQNPSSPLYHQWLTPAEYAARFGMSQADLDRVTGWLQSQGLTVQGVSRDRNSLSFSGTAAQVEAAFQTQIHNFRVRGKLHFANASPISIPAALAPVVLGVRHLNDFRPQPRAGRLRQVAAPHYTVNLSPNEQALAPADFATIYDVTGLYNSGFDGAGQKLVVVGQTAVNLSDIDAFRSNSDLPQNEPELILVPNTGGGVVSQDDLGEADLDLEWSGAVAKNATIIYVYAGNNAGVYDALYYTIDNDLAPVISITYGTCEPYFGALPYLRQEAQRANAQGQTIVADSSDFGAADCDFLNWTTKVTSASGGLAVDVPAAIPEATGVGGTTFSADQNNPSQYWNPTNSPGGGSVLKYIPETSWNDTVINHGLLASGGGHSSSIAKPSWQSAPGVPQDGYRDVPDIALAASPYHDGYLVCTSGRCVNGFLNSYGNVTVFGGTSAGAPTFAGILTLIEQALQSNGAGNLNPLLYQLASTPSVYASAFHDITTGNNKVPCTSGTRNCPSGTSEFGYDAGPGYDLVTGLGSVDAFNLEQAMLGQNPPPAPKIATTTSVGMTTSTPAAGANVTYNATITPSRSGAAPPTGTVQFTDSGVLLGDPVTMTNHQASTTMSYDFGGTHQIQAIYSGDSEYAGSSGYGGTVTVTGPVANLSLSASPQSLTFTKLGGVDVVTITASSNNGLSGTVYFTCSVAPVGTTSASKLPICAIPGSITLTSGTTSGDTKLTVSAAASGLSIPAGAGDGRGNGRTGAWAAAMLLLLFAVFAQADGLRLWRKPVVCGRMRPRLGMAPARRLAAAALFGLLLALAGCGGRGSSSTSAPTPPISVGYTTAGSFVVTVTGTGPSGIATQTTTVNVTVQ